MEYRKMILIISFCRTLFHNIDLTRAYIQFTRLRLDHNRFLLHFFHFFRFIGLKNSLLCRRHKEKRTFCNLISSIYSGYFIRSFSNLRRWLIRIRCLWLTIQRNHTLCENTHLVQCNINIYILMSKIVGVDRGEYYRFCIFLIAYFSCF